MTKMINIAGKSISQIPCPYVGKPVVQGSVERIPHVRTSSTKMSEAKKAMLAEYIEQLKTNLAAKNSNNQETLAYLEQLSKMAATI